MTTIRFFCIICGTVLEGATDSRADVMICKSCAHHVPVPRLADIPCGKDGCGPVFPPGVLELSVKFLCASCQTPLRADARWEGRTFTCPVCSDKVMVPQWSRVARWPQSSDAESGVPKPMTPEVVKLSADEIEFLSATAVSKSGENV